MEKGSIGVLVAGAILVGSMLGAVGAVVALDHLETEPVQTPVCEEVSN